MTNQRLQHDAAFAMAGALLGIVRNCVREEEWRDAFDAFYQACRAGNEAYEIQADRVQRRLRPSRN